MNPEDAAVQAADISASPSGAFIKDGTVTDVIGSSATVAVDGGGTARPTILGTIPVVDQRVTMLFDPADNGTCVILGTIGGADERLDLLPIVAPATGDYLALTDTSDGDASARSLVSAVLALVNTSAILALVYPIGCIYFSTNSTNPATSLGFGTWSAFGAGRVPVGFDSGNVAFDTDEETGGAQTVTLALSEVPAHTHDTSYLVRWQTNTSTTGGASIRVTDVNNTSGAAGGSTGNATSTSNSKGGGGAHNNLQPYIVVRMWKRTA